MDTESHYPSGWIVCRNLQQIPLPDLSLLAGWAERGRLRPDDYVVNPGLERCFQAREVPELKRIFRRTQSGPGAILDSILSWVTR